MSKLATFAVCLGWVATAASQATSGANLKRDCQAVGLDVSLMTGLEGMKSLSCMGFVHGVVDGWILAGKPLCIPDDISYSEESLAVRDYLDQHPGELNLQPGVLVLRALNKTWPCRFHPSK